MRTKPMTPAEAAILHARMGALPHFLHPRIPRLSAEVEVLMGFRYAEYTGRQHPRELTQHQQEGNT